MTAAPHRITAIVQVGAGGLAGGCSIIGNVNANEGAGTSDWLRELERIGSLVREQIEPMLGTAEGGEEVGVVGAGGDRTLAIDQRAEDIALDELTRLAGRGWRCSVLSEEAGLVDLGAEYPRIVIDPVDGSQNARRGIRMVGVMFSLLNGPTLAGVEAGYTVDVAKGDSWCAIRDHGAFHAGRRLQSARMPAGSVIDVLGLHAAPSDISTVEPLLAGVSQFRQLYCMSLSLVYTAMGAIDVFCSPRRARIFDLTAGLLLIREVGGVVTDLAGQPLDDLPIDLTTRTTLLCSAHPDLHSQALRLLAVPAR